MSVENLKEYAKRCANDPQTLQAAKEFGIHDIEKHIGLSESLGLKWDMDDWSKFQHEVTENLTNEEMEVDMEELNEEELELVAGGLFSVTIVSALAAGAAVGGVVGAAAGAGAAGGAAAAGDGGW